MTDGAIDAPPIAESRVLVVEDNPRVQKLIEAFLLTMGIRNMAFADNGVIGLEKLPEFQPDLIILDIMMPEMNGLEFLGHLRADPEWGRLPVLVQTALGSQEDVSNIFAAGANDMLTKPLNRDEFTQRVTTHLTNRLLARAYEERLRLNGELDAARRMQEALMPPRTVIEEIFDNFGVAVDSYFQTSSELGGDFWGVRANKETDPGFAVFTADFSGHGLGAALNTFRLHTLMNYLQPDGDDPAEYLGKINRELRELLPRGQYATMFYGVIDLNADTLTFAGAAAPPPLFRAGKDGPVTALDASGVPLGMSAGTTYQDQTIDFPPGSSLFLYSDALFETERADKPPLGLDGTEALLNEAFAQKEHGTLEYLLGMFLSEVEAPLPDDLTTVLVRRKG